MAVDYTPADELRQRLKDAKRIDLSDGRYILAYKDGEVVIGYAFDADDNPIPGSQVDREMEKAFLEISRRI